MAPEAEEETVVDAFPRRVYESFEGDLQRDLELFTRMDAIRHHAAEAVPVIPHKAEFENGHERVAFHNLISDRHVLLDRFRRLYEDASRRLIRTGREDVSWSSMDAKMLKEPRLAHRESSKTRTNKTDGLQRRGNADNRQSFVYRCQHLVKKHVTNGTRTTPAGTRDLYVVFGVPILIYSGSSGCCPEGSFYAGAKRLFRPFLLNPVGRDFTIYCVPPESTYLTISLQKTCYAILRVSEAAFCETAKRYPLYDAFDELNAFVPQPRDVLEALTEPRRKRGRPAKSLDSLYWNPEPRQQDGFMEDFFQNVICPE